MTKRTPNNSPPLGLKSHFATCDEVLEPKALPYLTLEAEVKPINKVSCGSNPLRAHRSTRAALSPKFRGRLPLPPPDEWMSPLSAPGFFLPADLRICIPSQTREVRPMGRLAAAEVPPIGALSVQRGRGLRETEAEPHFLFARAVKEINRLMGPTRRAATCPTDVD